MASIGHCMHSSSNNSRLSVKQCPGYHVSQSAHWLEGTDFSDPTFEALDVGSKRHGDGAICSGANLSRYEQEELCAKQLGASELIGIGSSGCESYVCSC